MTPAQIRRLYGSIYSAWEYEFGPDMKRTWRKRKRQHVSYPRPWDPKPIIKWEFA